MLNFPVEFKVVDQQAISFVNPRVHLMTIGVQAKPSMCPLVIHGDSDIQY